MSDQLAVGALARRFGRDLAAEGVELVPMGGATNIRRFIERYGPSGADVRLAGLCDVGEGRVIRRGLELAGLGTDLTPEGMEELGFFLCDADLEDELIRALGAAAVERVIEANGELSSLRILQQQPAQRDRTVEQHLRRFMGSKGGRKIHYAPQLVDALDLASVPRPLQLLLAAIAP